LSQTIGLRVVPGVLSDLRGASEWLLRSFCVCDRRHTVNISAICLTAASKLRQTVVSAFGNVFFAFYASRNCLRTWTRCNRPLLNITLHSVNKCLIQLCVLMATVIGKIGV